jgi:hypothetical protein
MPKHRSLAVAAPCLVAAAQAATTLPSYLEYLSREVPRWERENHCFSCHNNGDGARALYLAQRKGYAIPREALEQTTTWLRQPLQWTQIRGAAGSNDKNLARVQFASALVEAWRSGAVRDAAALRTAAELLIANQDPGGSWPVDAGGLPGAPATYGTALATYMARGVLEAAGGPSSAQAIHRINRWFATAKHSSVVDAAAIVLALPGRKDCHEWLLAAQLRDGGWGPQRGMPAQAFDTAVAVLALRGKGQAARRGRAFLARMQEKSGAWPETTRPAGAVSYAERISTAGWVAYALMATQ